MTRPDNPLVPRVIVNRLWQHHHGRGIVASPSDFGVRGEWPSHPELLDWLATELLRDGWRLKPIHRLMVTSSTYRQASDPARSVLTDPAAIAEAEALLDRQRTDDPDNLLFGRIDRRRREAEALRDAMLRVAGVLNPAMGGPGVRPPIPAEVEALIFTEAEVVDLWPEDPDPSEHDRRSLYLYRKRNVRYPIFDAFDAPDTQTACAVRDESTHALQALILLNGAFAIDRAKDFAGRLYREVPADSRARLDRAYRVALGRLPTAAERDRASSFLDAQADLLRTRPADGPPLAAPSFLPPDADTAVAAAWVDLALALLNCNEFVYVP